MGSWPKIDRSEVTLAPLFRKALNEGELTMKKIKTDVHLALFQLECFFFTIFGSPLFNFGPTFRGHAKTMERNQLDFQMQNFM